MKDAVIVGLVVALAVMVGQVVQFSHGTADPEPVVWARFASPSAGDRIAGPIDVRGIAALPQSQELWVLSRAPNNRIYTVTDQPTPVTIDAHGDWAVHDVGLGRGSDGAQGEGGKRYELFLVATPSGNGIAQAVQQQRPDRQNVELTQLPGKSVVLDSVSIELSS